MLRKISLCFLWLGFISYAFFFSPPDNFPESLELIKNLSTGNWQGINPIIIALFNIMGIWPLIYSSVLFIDGRGQKIRAWPFATASFAVGAFALLPYLALREPNQEFIGVKNLLIKIFDSRITGILLTLSAGILFIYSFQGNWSDFIQQWQISRFIHVMSLDFCMLSLLFPAVLGDDMTRRGWKDNQLFWLFALIPLFGALIYLCMRPSLKSEDVKLTPR
ncbi:DUF2834 domain-containing protein [Anabaena cylindrica FACHB-243]|uniref:DUF2834 domain-containing protein n=1 Tax=Anabaena cylindrica (strain ATCC 27899 / PCC 7122) TaxID=272123 RepID=K9ZCS2_ANACC|nr:MULTISPECIES: hypothetical protein [Anabaena]AFZ56981.1 hypothetical protein Anacy_1472 [Anabaena cylindrica PCC 7122]MBD2418891.1 DUF2834 domain-containing protein [Anabaena cylindrica FACHB-243]MBY5285494.1 DUF2834 domain-containing protein [Anabaena sp. CCAP 1446/1C]MBY5311807.1 DUF2834 domain-containing protein [Anabaena sp. CCAP 1446/1C]MCM2405171.1 DUF2834 domain-containing protein [Anabaena sp. CCAP 1446/1C]